METSNFHQDTLYWIAETFGASGMVIIIMILVATFCSSVSYQKVPLFYCPFPVSNILQCLMVRQQQPCVHIACFHKYHFIFQCRCWWCCNVWKNVTYSTLKSFIALFFLCIPLFQKKQNKMAERKHKREKEEWRGHLRNEAQPQSFAICAFILLSLASSFL